MKKQTWHALVAFAALAVATVAGPGALGATSSADERANDSDVVAALDGYTNWTRATREPYLVSPAVNAACAPAAPARTDPHAGAYITVFVNETGRAALFRSGDVAFPEGSVIVKEKRHDAGSDAPELMTVMVKRARGYDPAVGDWEFAVVDGTGRQVRAQGKLATCAQCHASVPKSDFVFRTYLSDAR